MKIVGDIAVINNRTPLITDAQSALDLIASVGYEHHVYKIAINKAAIDEKFFKLSTNLAGNVQCRNSSTMAIGSLSSETFQAIQASLSATIFMNVIKADI